MSADKQSKGIGKGTPGPGRPKGQPNKTTASAKEAFTLAFQGIGGAERLQQWAEENTTEFYKLFARLIPAEQHVSGADGQPLGVVILPPVTK